MIMFTPIDLSQLPAPTVIKQMPYDTLFAEMKSEAIRLMPDLKPFLALESEPVAQLLRVCAYVRHRDRMEFNDQARATMLAYATGSDLDQLAALWGVKRQVVQKADESVSPPIEQILETDARLRQRVQLSLEGHTSAGSIGAYSFHALSADAKVKDVSVTSPRAGEVLVSVLSKDSNGQADNTLLSAVQTALNADSVRPLCDRVTVKSATIITYQIDATLTLANGPDRATVLAAARKATQTYIAAQHKIGHDVTISGLHAALHQSGVHKVVFASPTADIAVNVTSAAYCAPDAFKISVGGS